MFLCFLFLFFFVSLKFEKRQPFWEKSEQIKKKKDRRFGVNRSERSVTLEYANLQLLFESSLPRQCSAAGTECKTRLSEKSYEISTPNPYPAQRNCIYTISCNGRDILYHFKTFDFAKKDTVVLEGHQGNVEINKEYNATKLSVQYTSGPKRMGNEGLTLSWKCAENRVVREP